MRFAIIENGIVANIAVADGPLADNWIEAPDEAQIGGAYDGTFHPAPPPVPVVPQVITPRQARLALLRAGLLASVDSALTSLPEPQKSAAQVEWEYATKVERNSALVNQLGAALGLSQEQIDALFIQAESL